MSSLPSMGDRAEDVGKNKKLGQTTPCEPLQNLQMGRLKGRWVRRTIQRADASLCPSTH